MTATDGGPPASSWVPGPDDWVVDPAPHPVPPQVVPGPRRRGPSHGDSSPQSFVVDVELSRDGETHHSEVPVVQEDGGFRAW